MDKSLRAHHAIWPRRLPRELVVPQTSLWFNLEVAAARFPDKPALLFFGQSLGYAQLKDQAEALAGWLQAQGVLGVWAAEGKSLTTPALPER